MEKWAELRQSIYLISSLGLGKVTQGLILIKF